MEIQTLNEHGRKYIEAVQVVSTDPVYSISRLSVLEVLYFCSVIMLGFYVGFTLLPQT